MTKQITVTNLSAGLVAAGKISYALRAEGTTAYGAEVNTGITEVLGSTGEYLASIDAAFYGSIRWTEWTTYGTTVARQAVEDLRDAVGSSTVIAAIKAKTDLISAGDIALVTPVTNNGSQITLVAGDDYFHAHGRSLELTSSDFPDLAGASCTLRIISRDTNAVVFSIDGTIVDPTTLRFEIPKEKTSLLAPATIGTYVFAARITFGDNQIATEIRGQVLVLNG